MKYMDVIYKSAHRTKMVLDFPIIKKIFPASKKNLFNNTVIWYAKKNIIF